MYMINLFGNDCKIQLFADDTLLYVIGETEAGSFHEKKVGFMT